MSDRFDDLTRIIASEMPRREMLKRMFGTLAGSVALRFAGGGVLLDGMSGSGNLVRMASGYGANPCTEDRRHTKICGGPTCRCGALDQCCNRSAIATGTQNCCAMEDICCGTPFRCCAPSFCETCVSNECTTFCAATHECCIGGRKNIGGRCCNKNTEECCKPLDAAGNIECCPKGCCCPRDDDPDYKRCRRPGARLQSYNPGPPAQVIMEASSDTDAGIGSISVVQAVNVSVDIPVIAALSVRANTPYALPRGTTHTKVIATKIDPSKKAQIMIRVCLIDCPLCCIDGDPVELTLTGGERWGSMKILTGIPEAEGKVTVTNHMPGLSAVALVVNGQRFRLTGLRDGEELTVDVAAAMKPGDMNEFVVRAEGLRGSSARILIWDGIGDLLTHPNQVRAQRAGQLVISQ
jgi:hypothetical protein